MNENQDYMQKTIAQIENVDSIDGRWDKAHFLAVAKTCGCKGCYCCAVQAWANQREKKSSESVM